MRTFNDRKCNVFGEECKFMCNIKKIVKVIHDRKKRERKNEGELS